MALSIGVFTRALSSIANVIVKLRKRQKAERWVGEWEAYELAGRQLAQPMEHSSPATVTLPPWWKFSTRLTFECHECDDKNNPTRYQKGQIIIDQNDPDTATRRGCYVRTAEFYEQRLTMLDPDTILIVPIPEYSALGDIYGRHGWRRKP